MGQQTATSVMTSWMNSPGHKANILSKDFTEIGVGVAKNESGTIYWTQDFIGKQIIKYESVFPSIGFYNIGNTRFFLLYKILLNR